MDGRVGEDTLTFDYKCQCGKAFEVFYAPGYPAKDKAECQCGKEAERVFTPTTQMIIPQYMRAQSHSETSRYDKWFNSESTQKKLKSGDYRIMRKSDDAAHQ